VPARYPTFLDIAILPSLEVFLRYVLVPAILIAEIGLLSKV
jgi:hypothetical protein